MSEHLYNILSEHKVGGQNFLVVLSHPLVPFHLPQLLFLHLFELFHPLLIRSLPHLL